ncbi:MAG: hypothetical protein LBD29_09940 [Treponema sp.]|jgi:hypothetical protein|nr:hypothetical protein [Treponema sp.]
MWDTFRPKDTVWYRWRLNGAEAYLKKDGESWQTAFKIIPFYEWSADFGGPEERAPPESLSISNAWGFGDDVALHPYLSLKPYLLTVRERMRISPGMDVCFAADLPPLLKFELSPETVLAEAEPFSVSQTWFGADTMTGEFGYSLIGRLLPRQSKQKGSSSTLIHCEIYIKNNAKTMFDLDDFVVYPEHLNVYLYEDRLISDTLELEYLGTDEKINVNETKGYGYKLISPSIKTDVGTIIARRSVDLIKHITRFC